MATNENLIPIPGRLHSVASDKIVSGANEIYDDELQIFLNDINKDIESTKTKITEIEGIIGSEDISGDTIINRINDLELSVGEGGSVDQRISDAVTIEKDRAEDIEGGLQTQINALDNNKLKTLSVGAGITLTSDGVISATADPSVGKVVESLPLTDIIDGMIYLVLKANTPGTYVQWVHYGNDWTNKGEISLDITTDNAIDSTSTNPIQNNAITAQIGYFVCAASGSDPVKNVDAPSYSPSDVGGAFKIKMNYTNTCSDTVYLQFNSNANTKKELKYNREPVTPTNTWDSTGDNKEVISVYYDGTYYQASNAQGGGNAAQKKIGYTEPDKVLKCHEEYIGDTGIAIDWQYAKYPVSEGDVVIVTGTGGGSGRLWAIARSDGYILSRSGADASENGKVLVMPTDAAWIVLNSTIATAEWYYAKAGSVGADAILGKIAKYTSFDNSQSIFYSDDVQGALDEIDAGGEIINFMAESGSSIPYYVNSENKWFAKSNSYPYYSRIIPIDNNRKYRITAKDSERVYFTLLSSDVPDTSAAKATEWGNPVFINPGESLIVNSGIYSYLCCRYGASVTTSDYPKTVEKLYTFTERNEAIDKKIDSVIYSNVDYTIAERNKYINSSCVIVTESAAAEFVITEPIQIKKGDLITVNTKGGLMYVLAEYSNGAIARGLVFSGYTDGEVYREYSYIAENDMEVIVCGVNDSVYPLKITAGRNINKRVEQLSQYHCGIYLYPFKAIVGKPVTIYKESVVSGLSPIYNYFVTVGKDREDVVDDYGKYSIRVNPTTEGTIPLTVSATDQFNNTITKTVNVTCRNMPSEKLSNVDSMDVMFLGDSMIAFNHNLIGEEWRRMLATNDSTPHVDPVTKAIQLPTYNVCPNKIRLVGEDYKASDTSVRYCYAFTLNTILTGKRTTGYSPTSNPGRTNPFYNKNSTNPDTIGADGFNQRVDFGWYFDNACGVGKYPKLFYIAAGVNDIGQTWNWSFDGIEPTTELLLKVIKKIKAVCDERAGGDSGVRFKVFNHQTYPMYNGYHYENPLMQQRLVWNRLYDCYQETIKNPTNGVSEYVDFVDCASRFDWRVGYTQEDISTNARYDGNQDVFIGETCHMNNVGSFNYADCLIDDFLADSYFD